MTNYPNISGIIGVGVTPPPDVIRPKIQPPIKQYSENSTANIRAENTQPDENAVPSFLKRQAS